MILNPTNEEVYYLAKLKLILDYKKSKELNKRLNQYATIFVKSKN